MKASCARLPTHCPTCQHRPTSTSSALQLAAELDILWLILKPTDPAQVTTARYCRSCVPHGPVTEIVCTSCGDGPLLSGALADENPPPVMLDWLSRHGWTVVGVGTSSWTARCRGCSRGSLLAPARVTG